MTTVQLAEALLDALVAMPAGPSGELDALTDLLLENGLGLLARSVVYHFSRKQGHTVGNCGFDRHEDWRHKLIRYIADKKDLKLDGAAPWWPSHARKGEV